MEADKTTPAWAKLLLGQMGSLLKIAAELLTEQTTTYGNFELHLKQQQQQIEENERQHCLVITGLEESNKQEAIARAKEDQEKVLEVINMCKVDIGLPTAVFRMGIKKINSCRPIKVKMPSKAAVREILRGKKFIINNKLNTHTNFNIRVRESLTSAELQSRSDLVKKCFKMRSEHPGADYIIYASNVILRSEINNFKQTLSKNL
ncbi:hypothetical protein ACQ4LE_011004 [Meloidogyne hapla]